MIQKRILAFVLDLVIIMVLGIVFEIITGLFISDYYWKAAISSLPFAYLLTKDSFTGRSLGRKSMKITIVNNDGIVAGPWKDFIRNVFIILWPVELLVLIGCNRRIGDMITHTKVIDGEKHHKFSIIGVLITLLTWIAFAIIIYTLMHTTLFGVSFI